MPCLDSKRLRMGSSRWKSLTEIWTCWRKDLMMYLADTNIVLRFLLRKDPAYPAIRHAVRSLKARGEQIVITSQSMAEFWNVCTRPSTARGGLGLSVEATEMRLRLLERHFPVLPDSPVVYERWKELVLAHKVIGVNVHDA